MTLRSLRTIAGTMIRMIRPKTIMVKKENIFNRWLCDLF